MIGEKILKIMSEITPIEKTGYDEEGNYKFAKSEEIIAIVKPLLEKYKVIILPVKVINFSAQGDKVYITMKYQIIDIEDNSKDCIEIEIPASGFDKKGKSVYAALTGAYRYAMQQAFAIPVVDEIRNDDNKSKDDENSVSIENEDNIINNVDITDLDKLFSSEKIA